MAFCGGAQVHAADERTVGGAELHAVMLEPGLHAEVDVVDQIGHRRAFVEADMGLDQGELRRIVELDDVARAGQTVGLVAGRDEQELQRHRRRAAGFDVDVSTTGAQRHVETIEGTLAALIGEMEGQALGLALERVRQIGHRGALDPGQIGQAGGEMAVDEHQAIGERHQKRRQLRLADLSPLGERQRRGRKLGEIGVFPRFDTLGRPTQRHETLEVFLTQRAQPADLAASQTGPGLIEQAGQGVVRFDTFRA